MWQWTDDIDALVHPVYWFAQFWDDTSAAIEDCGSVLGDQDSVNAVIDTTACVSDIMKGYQNLAATHPSQAAQILNILTNQYIVADTNYTVTQFITGLANLTPQQLSTVQSQLEDVLNIDGQNIPQTNQQYIARFFQNLTVGVPKQALGLIIRTAAEGLYHLGAAYFAAQFPADMAATAGTSASVEYLAGGAVPLLDWDAANALFQTFIAPQLPLQQDQFKIAHTLTTVYPELISIATNMTDSHGLPNFEAGTAFTADLGIAISLEYVL